MGIAFRKFAGEQASVTSKYQIVKYPPLCEVVPSFVCKETSES